MNAYGPYLGDRDREEIWFDDNAWWGLAFIDAYRATGDKRYLSSAARASRFIDAQGWDSKHGGMRWSTNSSRKINKTKDGMVSFGGATALAAELWEYTRQASFRKMARKYVAWGDAHAAPRVRHENRRPVTCDGDGTPAQ